MLFDFSIETEFPPAPGASFYRIVATWCKSRILPYEKIKTGFVKV